MGQDSPGRTDAYHRAGRLPGRPWYRVAGELISARAERLLGRALLPVTGTRNPEGTPRLCWRFIRPDLPLKEAAAFTARHLYEDFAPQ